MTRIQTGRFRREPSPRSQRSAVARQFAGTAMGTSHYEPDRHQAIEQPKDQSYGWNAINNSPPFTRSARSERIHRVKADAIESGRAGMKVGIRCGLTMSPPNQRKIRLKRSLSPIRTAPPPARKARI